MKKKSYAHPIRKPWSKQLIIEEIRRLHGAGMPVNSKNLQRNYSGLESAGRKFFGSWRAAIEAAGLSYKDVCKKMQEHRWTKAKILDQIWHIVSLGVNPNSEGMRRNYRCLYASAAYHFGSWRSAVEAAGFVYASVRLRSYDRKWSKEAVIAEILGIHARAEPLNATYVRKHYSPLANAADAYWHSWREAIEAAGFNYDMIRKVSSWSHAKVIEQIRSLAASKSPLNSSYVQRTHPSLFDRARFYFVEWKHAIEAAGFSYAFIRLVPPKRVWSKDAVVIEIHSRINRGLNINAMSMKLDDNPMLSAACKLFGTWEAAVEAAGYRYRDICKVFREKDIRKTETDLEKLSRYAKKRKELT